ncbi:MAG: PSD1 and planctomycete cytochrome C domain-containing protein [Acidobacteriota bacterium]
MRYSLVVFLYLAGSAASAQSPNSPEFFENKVRPLLAKNCYACHTQSALGGLRLDSGEALAKGGKRGPAVNSAEPEKSPLLIAVRHADPGYKMPMGNKLKDDEIQVLEAWVKAGAKWPVGAKVQEDTKAAGNGKYVIRPEARQFWSLQPLREPAVPAAKWGQTPIDRFVAARLEKEGLKPVRPASKRDLLRRATLDLTGLPPTYDEIQAFEKDTSPNAFAKVVDRLLASPHYGERWGRFWLDVARYGEDDYRSLDPMRRGHNPYPNAFNYRDWVIQAFQDDMPYDHFVKAQLAGDLLDPKTRHKTLPGTGFLGLGPWYYDNGSTEVTRADERHDRVDVISRGFLGLTVGCARCHDHKYDPIPATDYYALAGVFYNTIYEEYPLVPKTTLAEFEKIEEHIDLKQKMLGEIQQNVGANLSKALALETANYLQGVWEVTGPQKKEKATVVDSRRLDYEVLDRWIAYMEKATDKYRNKEAWQAMMKKKGSTAAEAKRLAEKFQEEVVAVMLARYDLDEQNKVIQAKAIEGTKKKKRTNKPSNFVTNDDFCPGCNLTLLQMPEADTAFWTEIFQRMLSDSDDPNAMMAAGNRFGKPGVLTFRGWGLESRSGSETQAQIAAIRKDIDEARKKLEPGFPYLHGVKDAPEARNIQLAFRGDPFDLKQEVPRHFLSILSPSDPAPFQKGSGRLELAEQIVKQPIAMRVFVNRVWKGHFGTGIVDSPSNFGMTGERPTNPDLLEYLASNFVKNGLSVKKLHRDIMLSSVYQLSTESDPVALAKDSGNRLYWRADKKRLDAEQIRDSVLQVSGKLDKAVGGPSVELSPAVNRRTVYGKVSRYKLDEYLSLFDFPTPLISAEKRFVTTVPTQRLFLMNSDFMQVQAEALVERVAAEPNNPARIRKLYQIVYGREATPEEISLGLEYLKTEPLLEYEEGKKKAPAEAPRGPGRGRRSEAASAASKPAPDEADKPGPDKGLPAETAPAAAAAAPEAVPPADAFGMGMMGGMGRRGPGGTAPPPIKYEPTVWGRYAKVLLSASEFLFIN